MIDGLELTAEHAELIIEKAIEFGAYSDEMPESDKDKVEAAHEQIAFMIDARVDDGVTADAEDPDVAEAGQQIDEVFEIAGIEIDDEGNVTFGELPEIESEDDDEDDDSDDEFDINDIIKNYDKLSTAKVLAALEDLDEDDIEKVKEYEREEGKGRDQILEFELDGDASDDDDDSESEDGEELTRSDLDDYDRDALKALIKENDLDIKVTKKMTDDDIRDKIAEVAELPSDADDDDEEDEGDEDEESTSEAENPWGDDEPSTVADVKAALEAAKDDDEDPLEPEQVQSVLDWENDRPNRDLKVRPSLVKWLEKLRDELAAGDDEDDDTDEEAEEEAEEEKPKGKGKSTKKTAKQHAEDNGLVIVLTREQILTALDSGEVEIEVA